MRRACQLRLHFASYWKSARPLRKLSRCSSIPSYYYANLAVCDRDHGAVFEMTPKQVVRRDAEDALLPCTNQFRSPSLAVNQQCWRYDRLESTRRDESVDVSEIQLCPASSEPGRNDIADDGVPTAELVLHLSMGAPPSSGHKLQRLELAKPLTAPAN